MNNHPEPSYYAEMLFPINTIDDVPLVGVATHGFNDTWAWFVYRTSFLSPPCDDRFLTTAASSATSATATSSTALSPVTSTPIIDPSSVVYYYTLYDLTPAQKAAAEHYYSQYMQFMRTWDYRNYAQFVTFVDRTKPLVTAMQPDITTTTPSQYDDVELLPVRSTHARNR